MFDNKDKRKAETFETLYLRIDDDKAAPSDMTDTVAYMPFRAITLEEDEWHRKWVESGDPHAYYLDGMNEVYDMDDPNDTRHYGGPLLHRSRYYSLKNSMTGQGLRKVNKMKERLMERLFDWQRCF